MRTATLIGVLAALGTVAHALAAGADAARSVAAVATAPAAAGAPAAGGSAAEPGSSGVLTDATIEALILASLAERQVDLTGAAVEVTALSSRPGLAENARIDVERFSWQPAGRKFTAVLAAVSPGRAVQRMTVIGRLCQDSAVPVLVRRMQPGEVIAASDLQWMPVRDRSVPANALADPDEMVGYTPRRALLPGTPIIAGDLKRPATVLKGAPVTLVLALPNMQLTARGRALEEGATGQTIRVANAQSRSVIEGVVLANGQVAVGDGIPQSRQEARR